MTRRSVARPGPSLLSEDPQRRLDARKVNTLAHQVSLVRRSGHAGAETCFDRRRSGTRQDSGGGTAHSGAARGQSPSPGALPRSARLVRNVRREFIRLELPFRQWTATDRDARLEDQLVVASIHKAVHGANTEQVLNSGPWDILVVDECPHLTDW